MSSLSILKLTTQNRKFCQIIQVHIKRVNLVGLGG